MKNNLANRTIGCLRRNSSDREKVTAMISRCTRGASCWKWATKRASWSARRVLGIRVTLGLRSKRKVNTSFSSQRHPTSVCGTRYKPFISAGWDGQKAHFFAHKERKHLPPVPQIPWLVLEWTLYRTRYFLLLVYWLSLRLSKRCYRILSKKRKPAG